MDDSHRSLRERLCEMTLQPIDEQSGSSNVYAANLRTPFASWEAVIRSRPIPALSTPLNLWAIRFTTTFDIRGWERRSPARTSSNLQSKKQLLLERGSAEASKGDFVIYLFEGRFGHVGRLQDQRRILSKWGTGHLCEHLLWEVPCSYGHEVRFYQAVDAEGCFDIFVEYTNTRGFRWQS
jgi:hypothetical protein